MQYFHDLGILRIRANQVIEVEMFDYLLRNRLHEAIR